METKTLMFVGTVKKINVFLHLKKKTSNGGCSKTIGFTEEEKPEKQLLEEKEITTVRKALRYSQNNDLPIRI